MKSYMYLEHNLQEKLLVDLKEEKININEFREISRGISTLLNPLLVKEIQEGSFQ